MQNENGKDLGTSRGSQFGRKPNDNDVVTRISEARDQFRRWRSRQRKSVHSDHDDANVSKESLPAVTFGVNHDSMGARDNGENPDVLTLPQEEGSTEPKAEDTQEVVTLCGTLLCAEMMSQLAMSRNISAGALIRGILPEFVDAKPYKHKPFFWLRAPQINKTKHWRHARSKLLLTICGQDTVSEIMQDHTNRQRPIMNGAGILRRSSLLKLEDIWFTAIAWFSFICTTSAERELVGVARFISMVTESYRRETWTVLTAFHFPVMPRVVAMSFTPVDVSVRMDNHPDTKEIANADCNYLSVSAPSKPKLGDLIRHLLASVPVPLDYLEACSELKRAYPDLSINRGSVGSILSTMCRNGVITGTLHAGDSRVKYSIATSLADVDSPEVFSGATAKFESDKPINEDGRLMDVQLAHNGKGEIMPSIQSNAQSHVHHLTPRPTLDDSICKVLESLNKPLDARETFNAMKRMYPDLKYSFSSVQSRLSSMVKDGRLVALKATDGQRTRYTMPAKIVLSGDKSIGRQVSMEIEDITKTISDSTPAPKGVTGGSDLQSADRQLSISVSPGLLDAITALCQYRRGGTPSKRAVADIVRSMMLPAFLDATPYRDARFFWVKCWLSQSVTLSFSLPGSTAVIHDRITHLTRNLNLAKQGIAMDNCRLSSADRLTMTMIGHTAIVWFLAARITDVEMSIPSIASFLDYARNAYQIDGRNAVEVYQSLPCITPVDPPASPVSGPSCGDNEHGVNTVATSDSWRTGFTVDKNIAGGLTISLSPEIAERITSVFMDVLDVLTRS